MGKKLLLFIIGINLVLIAILLWRVIMINTEKGLIILYFYYGLIFVLNLFLALLFKIIKSRYARQFSFGLVLVLALAIPVFIYFSFFF